MNFRNWVRRNLLDRRERVVDVPKNRRHTKSYREAQMELKSSLDRATKAVKNNGKSLSVEVSDTLANILRNKKDVHSE